MKEYLRLFIAINFTNEIKDQLNKLAFELKKNTLSGRFTLRDNFHLTLVFIGETKDMERAIEAMEESIKKLRFSPFTISMEGLGKFKGRDKDIYWVGIKDNPFLNKLNETLTLELRKSEFNIKEQEFKPHLTLGRDVKLKKDFNLEDFKATIPKMLMEVDKIELMKSHRVNGKLTYTVVYTGKL